MPIDCAVLSSCEAARNVYAHSKSYEDKAIRLAYSIRTYGQSCRDLPIYMWYGKDRPPSSETVASLEKFDCILVEGPCVHPDQPLYNKIEACKTVTGARYQLWLDTDIFVRGDFSSLWGTGCDVAAPPTTLVTNRWASPGDAPLWAPLYAAAGVPPTSETLQTHVDNLPGLFYLCSGLILFKSDCGFPALYADTAGRVMGSGAPHCLESFTQTALSLAVLKGNYKFEAVPENLHHVYCVRWSLPPDVVITHYQDGPVKEIPDKDWNVDYYR